MTPDQFAYWLQGFAELNAEPPSAEQWQSIREHLQAVFKKVTPPVQQLGGLGQPLDQAWLRANPQCNAQAPGLAGKTVMIC